MRIRRCAHLSVALEDEPRFDFLSVLAGGDGLARKPRWLAFAPHLDEPVELAPELVAVIGAIPADAWLDPATLRGQFGAAAIDRLMATGLMLDDGEGSASRRALDEAARGVDWWPPALVAQAGGAWDDVDVGSRMEAGHMPSARELVEAFGPAPEASVRRAPGARTLPLAPALRTAFDPLLEARRTCRNFDASAVLDAPRFSTMLKRVWGALGTRELAPGAVAVKKTSPAGGGLHAVDAYVLVQRVEGMAPGLYHYLALEHVLEPLQMLAPAEATGLARRFVAGQDWFRDVPVMVVMVARFDRLFWKYRRHAKAWRVAHLDVGHLSQTMYLSATELALGCFVTAAINDREIGRVLSLSMPREAAIAVVGFGERAAETTTMEFDTCDPVPARNR